MNAGSPFLGLSAVFTGFTFIWSGTCVSAIASFLGDDDFGIDSFLLSTSTYNFVIPHSLNSNFFKNEKASKKKIVNQRINTCHCFGEWGLTSASN